MSVNEENIYEKQKKRQNGKMTEEYADNSSDLNKNRSFIDKQK